MARLRYNGLRGTLGGSLTNSATSVTFGAALSYNNGTAVPTITGSDYIPLTILDSSGNLSEVVNLTAYTSGATTGTIARGQEGTSGVSHASGDKWVQGATVRDIGPRYAEVTFTSSNFSLTATTPTVVDAGLDVTVAANAGDLVEVGVSGLLGQQGQFVTFDVYSRVSGSNVAPWGPGVAASLTPSGVQAWYITNSAVENTLGGSIARVVTSSDVSSGSLTLRLMYCKATSTARTLYANANNPLKVWAINHGPV